MFKKLSFHEMQCLYNPLYLADIKQVPKIEEKPKIDDYESSSDYETTDKEILKKSINNNKKFIENNKDKIKEKIECNICKGSYTYFNKSKHNKTKRHVKFINK